ncbi:putative Pentatricopeptide repeat-containing protein [Zostera marina]|uniref:Putative Pentatricopeptide repeat-containing protein n=1 Tax=Zostera marina TaxID=29655 RepID=A0A0K9P9X5_ZOSMR|nr:putative Pentatricopeptide repeat-containing protein [Zostera marina]
MFLPSTHCRPPPQYRMPISHSISSSAVFVSGFSPRQLCFPSVVVVHKFGSRGVLSLKCSISQVDNYNTVDYEKKPVPKWTSLYRKISMMENPNLGASTVLEAWEVSEGKKLTKWDLCRSVKELRKFRRFKLALDVYEWIASHNDRYTFYSSDAAITLDLIAKAKGIASAEEYFQDLSADLKDKRTYCALLNAYTFARKRGKAEAIFETMKNNNYATEPLVFNVMMTFYMNIEDHEKVVEIITDMQDKHIELDIYSYNIWITHCAAIEDADEMDRVIGLMNSNEHIVATWTTYSTLASMNIRLGRLEKAVEYLKEAESRVTGRERMAFHYILGLYSLLGDKKEIHRIWKWYNSCFPFIVNKGYHSVLSALVKVGDISGADVIYEEWLVNTKRHDPKICNVLLQHYIKVGGKTKEAEACFERLLDQGGSPSPTTWELLGEGYIEEKRIEKAISCFKEAVSIVTPLPLGNRWRPRLKTIERFVEVCREMHDSASVEIMAGILREVGCDDFAEFKELIGIKV